jgi:hypothetical protein
MKIKHTLASSKDKKPTIRKSELSKLTNCDNLTSITLSYGSYKLQYNASRGGESFYCTTIPPHKFLMPMIGEPVYHEVILVEDKQPELFVNEFEPIRQWADKKGIYDKGDPKTQLIKLFEEAGELSKAILKNDEEEIIDAIGDCVIVLTNLCQLCRLYKENRKNIGLIDIVTIEDCINSAYNVIKNRTGKMKNGTFVKNEK